MPDCFAIETHHEPQPRGDEDRAWTAWYRADEPSDFGVNYGLGSTEQRAISDLVANFAPQVAA